MPTLNIDKFSEEDLRRLRARAAHNNRQVDEEARTILHAALEEERAETKFNLADTIRRRFGPLGGIELSEVPRAPVPEPFDFDR